MQFTKSEQETIITFDAESESASVYSAHPATVRKLLKFCAEFPETYHHDKEAPGGHFFTMPKRQICFRKPASDKRREASRKTALRNGFFTANKRQEGGGNDVDKGILG